MLGLFIALLILAVLAWLWLQQRIAHISTEDVERSITDAEQKADDLKAAAKSQLGTAKRHVPIQSADAPETAPIAETPVPVEPEEEREAMPLPVATSPVTQTEPEQASVLIHAEPQSEKETPLPAPQAESEKIAASVASEGDDLQRIEGIGPKYQEILVAAGITTYTQIARMSEDQILDVIRAGGGRKSASMSTWAEQAQLAAQGDWEALAKLQESLSGGRRDE